MQADTLAGALLDLLADPLRLDRLARQARAHALTHTPEASFNAFWAAHKRPPFQPPNPAKQEDATVAIVP